jgi:hypothetical protein
MTFKNKIAQGNRKLIILFVIVMVISCTAIYYFTILPRITFGAESNPTGNPIGGGTGYQPVYTQTDARVTYIVETRDEFIRALADVKAGEVIYIPEYANINLTGVFGTGVPGGVTIAGNRGVNGSLGGRIFQDRLPSDPKNEGISSRTMLHINGDGVRITGLRLEGPDKTTESLGEKVRLGIFMNDRSNVEVDNCELWGWSWGAVGFQSAGTGTMYVHHNFIHHCQSDGYGYGVVVTGGAALIEGNIFDYTRHAVAATGVVGESYEARYNIVLGHSTNHVFDVHGYTNPATGELIAGRSYKIHHNTVDITNDYSVGIRAVPLQGVWIYNNKFQWFTSYGINYPPVYQVNGEGRIYMTRNLIGTPGVLYKVGPVMQL